LALCEFMMSVVKILCHSNLIQFTL
jgi:hypothetical protein